MLGFFGNLMALQHTIVVVLHHSLRSRLRHSETLVADEPSLRRCVLCNLARFRFLMDEIDRFDVIILREKQ